MYIVAIHFAPGTGDVMAGALADALGKTLYEARARLNDPQRGPAVVGNFAEIEPAYAAGRLRANGIIPILLMPEDVETDARRFLVRGFQLGEHAITVSRRGETAELAYEEIDLILRGVRIAEQVKVKRTEQRKFSPVRAVVTGGLILTKTTREAKNVTTREREGFLHLYSGSGPVLAFHAGALDYGSLGPSLKPSMAANFADLLDALRRAIPRARYDERLANRNGGARMLGPSLTENHLDVAITLLARTLRQRS